MTHTRRWGDLLDRLPIAAGETVYDLGCGDGEVSRLLAERGAHVIGIDADIPALTTAQGIGGGPVYTPGNIRDLTWLKADDADGIWSSFAAAHCPDLRKTAAAWLARLKPGGWIGVVEIDRLFDHAPLPDDVARDLTTFEETLAAEGAYDSRAGGKLADALRQGGALDVSERALDDPEFTVDGPADDAIVAGWSARFDRMGLLRERLGEERFAAVRSAFLDCLRSPEHTSRCRVVMVTAQHP